MFSKPRNKQENYELYHKGYYGNHLKFWASLNEFLLDLDNGAWETNRPVALRTTFAPDMSLPNYCSSTETCDVKALAESWRDDFGLPMESIVVNEIGPNDKIILQGEVMRTEEWYFLHYSTEKNMMRQALKSAAKNCYGLTAIKILEQVMDSSSFDNLHRLMNEFPDAVIEFSVYDCFVGIQSLNTVFWEVRAY